MLNVPEREKMNDLLCSRKEYLDFYCQVRNIKGSIEEKVKKRYLVRFLHEQMIRKTEKCVKRYLCFQTLLSAFDEILKIYFS